MYYVNHYVIDWNKVQTLDDLKRIMESMNIAFEPDCPTVDGIIDLLRLEKKPKVGLAVMD
jgi:hypothetical protein